MIETFSKCFANYLVTNGADSAKENIYAYGMECFLNEIISDFLLLFLGILFNRIFYIIVWCISFTIIRIFLGGFHASTHARCILIGTIIGICSFYINPIWNYPWIFILVFIYTLILAIFYAPIIHKNHPVSPKKKVKAKKKAIFFITLESCLAFLLYPYHKELSSFIMTGFLTASLMASLAIANHKESTAKRQTNF